MREGNNSKKSFSIEITIKILKRPNLILHEDFFEKLIDNLFHHFKVNWKFPPTNSKKINFDYQKHLNRIVFFSD